MFKIFKKLLICSFMHSINNDWVSVMHVPVRHCSNCICRVHCNMLGAELMGNAEEREFYSNPGYCRISKAALGLNLFCQMKGHTQLCGKIWLPCTWGSIFQNLLICKLLIFLFQDPKQIANPFVRIYEFGCIHTWPFLFLYKVDN